MSLHSTFNLFIGRHATAWKNYLRQRTEIEQFPAGPPIFVTGSHRSGTTWVAAMLTVPGIWYIHEPFNPNKHMWKQNFSYLSSPDVCADVDKMIKRIMRGGARRALNLPNTSHPLMPLRWAPVRYKRLLLKDPLACFMAEYITGQLNAQTLALFRHPAGFVRSILNLGWPSAKFLSQFLETPGLIEDCLAEQKNLIKAHAKSDGLESAVVLHGCICRVLWLAAKRNSNIMNLRFEDLASDPIGQFRQLYSKLRLPYTDEARAMHYKLTEGASAGSEHGAHEVRRKSHAMAWKWRGSFSSSEIDRISGLWNEFGVSLYDDPEEWVE